MKLQYVLQNVVHFQLILLKNHIFSVVSLFKRECDMEYIPEPEILLEYVDQYI